MTATHKLERYGTGAGAWGKCSCGMWAWLGTYFGDKRRTTELRRQHAEHKRLAEQRRTSDTAVSR